MQKDFEETETKQVLDIQSQHSTKDTIVNNTTNNADKYNTEDEEDIRKIVLEQYKKIDNFYGLYYMHYKSPILMTIFRIAVTALALVLLFAVIPILIIKSYSIFLMIFIAVWAISFAIAVFSATKNHPIEVIYYTEDDKPVFLYSDKKYKTYTVNFGRGKKFEYFIDAGCWKKCDEKDIIPSKMYFDNLKGDLTITNKNDGTTLINCYKVDGKYSKRKGTLAIANDKPLYIEYKVNRTATSLKHPHGRRYISNRRIEFLEYDTKRFFEMPDSLIRYCEKQKVTPPNENDYLHLIEY